MAVGVVPAYQSPLVSDLFSRHTFREGNLPNLALSANPASGFDPTRMQNGTEVLFLPTPASLGLDLSPRLSPLWQNGLGMIAFRNPRMDVFGAIYLHTAVRNSWNLIHHEAWQCLGGLMLFSDAPSENKSVEALLEDVVRKSTAMTTKWQFIDENLGEIGHSRLSCLGGGKATASHPAGEDARRQAVLATAMVAESLGLYISGSDQNMTPELCTYFAGRAPKNFMGAASHPIPAYAGMNDPSPWTALGVFRALKTVRRELFDDRRIPIFFQGFGNVGYPLVQMTGRDGHPVAGIIEKRLDKLLLARARGIDDPLFLKVDPEDRMPDLRVVNEADITIVRSLIEALDLAPESEIFSPNADPHPLTMEVASALTNSKVKAVVGATNATLDLVDGSSDAIAHFLQENGIYNGNDSEGNQGGAASVVIKSIGGDQALMERLATGVGIRTLLNVRAFREGVPPQIARDKAAKRRYNRILREGRASGGGYEDVEP